MIIVSSVTCPADTMSVYLTAKHVYQFPKAIFALREIFYKCRTSCPGRVHGTPSDKTDNPPM